MSPDFIEKFTEGLSVMLTLTFTPLSENSASLLFRNGDPSTAALSSRTAQRLTGLPSLQACFLLKISE
jgi:hypothetical protein